MLKEYKPTKPKIIPRGLDPKLLAHGRYGTPEMIEIYGPERTFQFSLDAQAVASKTMSDLHPDILQSEYADEIVSKARLGVINPDRIRELESRTGHNVIAINKALEEVLSEGAKPYVNLAKTSADTTEPAKALQIKRAIEILSDSIENLRDISLEKAVEFIDVPHMDTTHLLDSVPTLAGRPLTFFAEMLQSDLYVLGYVYENSLMGKWSDVTGNYHSATALGIDGIDLEEEYCKRLGIGHMIASAQIPGREFLSDVVYGVARTAATMSNLATYIRTMKGSDADVFIDTNPNKRKGSSAMPHKDIKGGNPTAEEQANSFFNFMLGQVVTSVSSSQFDYARDLSGSASDRIVFDDIFKWGDHVVRNLAQTVFYSGVNKERAIERVHRSFGVVTSEWLLTYLTDRRRTDNPMPRNEAHDLVAKLATEAYNGKKQFTDVLLRTPEITSRFSEEIIREITDPEKFIGQSREIIETVFNEHHGEKTLDI